MRIAFAGVDDPHLGYDRLDDGRRTGRPRRRPAARRRARAVPAGARPVRRRRVRRGAGRPHPRRPGLPPRARRADHQLRPRAGPGQGPAPAPGGVAARRPGVVLAARLGRSGHQPVRPDPGRLPARGDPADAGRGRIRPSADPISVRPEVLGYGCRSACSGGHDRAVAQLGSALRSGRRGRRFKSCQPDSRGPGSARGSGPCCLRTVARAVRWHTAGMGDYRARRAVPRAGAASLGCGRSRRRRSPSGAAARRRAHRHRPRRSVEPRSRAARRSRTSSPRRRREPAAPGARRAPPPGGWLAAVVTGLVVGLGVVGLTWASLRTCEAVQGTSSVRHGGLPDARAGPGRSPVLVGGALLRLAQVPDPVSTSFLAVGLRRRRRAAVPRRPRSTSRDGGRDPADLRGDLRRRALGHDRGHRARGPRLHATSARGGDQLRDLHGVERRTLAQVVVAR